MQNIINDFQDEMDDLVDGYVHHVAQNQRRVIIPWVWLDPFATPSEREFTSRYRFSKDNCNRLVNMVTPLFDLNRNRRGEPCSARQIVCSGLEILAGGHFFRVNGYGGGIGKSTAWNNMYKLADALVSPEIREQFLHMPNHFERVQNMTEVYDKYGLHNVIGAVDGCHIPFLERPRNLPVGRNHVSFINRKGLYSINAQIVASINRKVSLIFNHYSYKINKTS